MAFNHLCIIFEETVANLGQYAMVDFDSVSVTKKRVILPVGSSLAVQNTNGGSSLTGSGVILIFVKVKRIHDLASIA